MKKISLLLLFLLTAFSFQCSDPSEAPKPGMNPELKKEVDALSIKLNAVWFTHYRTNFSKNMLTDPKVASATFDELRAVLDSRHQAYFDLVMKHPEMQKMIDWCKAQMTSVKNGGRIEDTWAFETVTSTEVKDRISQLHTNIDNTIGEMEWSTKAEIEDAINTLISDAENSAYQSTTLTQDDKNAFGSAAAILYGEVGSIVDEFFGSDIPIDQDRTQGWLKNFINKVGSVVVVTVACALAAAAIGAIIVATGGTALLAESAIITIGAAEFGIVSVAAAIGGAAGLTYSTAMAINNQCFSNGAGSTPLGFVSCDV